MNTIHDFALAVADAHSENGVNVIEFFGLTQEERVRRWAAMSIDQRRVVSRVELAIDMDKHARALEQV